MKKKFVVVKQTLNSRRIFRADESPRQLRLVVSGVRFRLLAAHFRPVMVPVVHFRFRLRPVSFLVVIFRKFVENFEGLTDTVGDSSHGAHADGLAKVIKKIFRPEIS